MIQIYGARDSVEAAFVKGLLETEDIHAVVMGTALEAVRGDIPYTQSALPSVWVNEADQAAAQVIVDEFKAGGPAKMNPQPAWTCPKCGEVLEGQFTACWKCAYDRPVAVDEENPQ